MTKTKNLTPEHLFCSIGGCPSINQLEDGRLRIVGEIDFVERNEKGEGAIIISPDLLSDYVAQASAGILSANKRMARELTEAKKRLEELGDF